MKSLIVGNWKMNPINQKEAKTLFDAVKKGIKVKNIEVVICPPFVYLHLLKGLPLGAQDVFFEEKGAYTGEISPAMLKNLKVEYVIIGHSERRGYFNETNGVINKKIKKSLEAGLNVIFCVGEKTDSEKSTILETQMIEGLKDVSEKVLDNLIIAYEPVWAIGTGKNCGIDETKSSVFIIKNQLQRLYGDRVADSIKILYGGSVNSKNAASYIKEAGVNGLLVGGASLDAKEFIKIVSSI